jgi:Bacterial capsule synthesis protein PGA_cap
MLRAVVLALLLPSLAWGERIELNVAGDVSWPESGFDLPTVDKKGAELFAKVRPFLASGDLNFVNLECPFTLEAPRIKKTYSYNCHPKRLGYLVAGGFNLYSLANNHSMDAGAEGAADTRRALAALGTEERPLWFAGTGDTPEAAQEPVLFTVRSTKVALFAVSNAAASSGVGSLHAAGLEARIAAAARQADIVLVSVHSGPEYIHVATPATVSRYHALIEAGADVVIGHHPHVVQGVELYRGGAIFYSLGNFSFASHTLRHKETGAKLYSMIGRVVLEDGKVSEVRVVPLYVNNAEAWKLGAETLLPDHCTPQPLTGAFAAAMIADLQDYGAQLVGASPTRLVLDGETARAEVSRTAIPVVNRVRTDPPPDRAKAKAKAKRGHRRR